jgi:hypothetical protein
MVENDFSPPERERGSFSAPEPPAAWSSVMTYVRREEVSESLQALEQGLSTNLQLQGLGSVVEHNLPKVATLGEMVLEDQLGSERDMTAELLPPEKQLSGV